MQEEVNQRTMALSIRASKLTGKVLASAFSKVVKAAKGRQSVKKLLNHRGDKTSIPYVGAPKDFDRIAKIYEVDYAFRKVSPGHYLLFFKAAQSGDITEAMRKYSEKVLHKGKEKTSILGQLRRFTELVRAKPKKKQRTREAVKDGR